MDSPGTNPEMPRKMGTASSPVVSRRVGANDMTLRILGIVKRWVSRHTGEILWAFVFAILAGYVIALYSEDPKPYKIYVVADPDTDSETLKSLPSGGSKS